MRLKYRGQSYRTADSTHKKHSETMEGQYQGIKTTIALPTVTSLSPHAHLMIYRGIPLADPFAHLEFTASTFA